MIPKIIHYIWLGGGQFSTETEQCIDSWHKHLPDYEIRRWDDESIQEIDCLFIREAIAEKKWAFASDVIRLHAINKYGGIYMDTDVMVYKSFNPLLHHHAFIGRENSMHQYKHTMENYLTTCCFGAEASNPFIRRCLEYYTDRHFITSSDRSLPTELRLDIRLNSQIFCILAKEIGYNSSLLADTIQHCTDNQLTILPTRYFDAIVVSGDTYTKHMALGTWREGKRKTYHYSIWYKISWRIEYFVKTILRKFDYVMVKLK